MEARGLFTKQGRFRAIAPHPLAVVLAATAWQSEGSRIVDELLPAVDREMGLALFSRVASLGQYEPARKVLRQLMSPEGLFGSLAAIEEHQLGRFLIQLAIVAPDETAEHLGELIESASRDDLLAASASRRDLVWALEKLAWHRQTFERAADSLLQLALAENETWANNATGTWVDLFGTMLPGTAALPNERITYLRRVAGDVDSAARVMVTKAGGRALTAHHESITVSGELQGGALVEPRGRPTTWDEAGHYRREAIGILSTLTADEDDAVSDAATEVLISAIHPLIDDAFVGDDLIEALKPLPQSALIRVRRDIEHLVSLQERHGPPDRGRLIDRLRVLSAALPPPSEREQLQVLLELRQWDLQDGELQSRLNEAVRTLSPPDREWALDLLKRQEQLPAAWELGWALAESGGVNPQLEADLVAAFGSNPAALVGYLRSLVEGGDGDAFDRFLDGPLAVALDGRDGLAIAARGPVTELSKARIIAMARELPVAEGGVALFGWSQNLGDDEAVALASDWLGRVASQQDYNTLVDWINLRVPSDAPLPDWLRPIARRIVMMRAEFPEMGQQRWDWSRLATQFVDDHAIELAGLILGLIDQDRLMIHRDDYESQILAGAASADPEGVWAEIAARLSAGSWRVQMEIRGWLLSAVPTETVEQWIGTDVVRARLVASVAPVGAESPTPTARLLLERFGDDEHVTSSLRGEFFSGSSTGPESDRLERQIEQLKGWQDDTGEPKQVRRWAGQMITHLEKRRLQSLQEEAERGF